MQVEARVEAKRTAVSDDVRHRLQRSLVLITGRDFVAVGVGAILPIGQEDGHLRAQFRELEGACGTSVWTESKIASFVGPIKTHMRSV